MEQKASFDIHKFMCSDSFFDWGKQFLLEFFNDELKDAIRSDQISRSERLSKILDFVKKKDLKNAKEACGIGSSWRLYNIDIFKARNSIKGLIKGLMEMDEVVSEESFIAARESFLRRKKFFTDAEWGNNHPTDTDFYKVLYNQFEKVESFLQLPAFQEYLYGQLIEYIENTINLLKELSDYTIDNYDLLIEYVQQMEDDPSEIDTNKNQKQ